LKSAIAQKTLLSQAVKTFLQHARAGLAGFKRPKKIVFTDLPKTTTGKVRKNELRTLAKSLKH